MNALPDDVYESTEPRVTAITCPECAGSLRVQREGRGTLRFTCRVGHAISVDELLTGKEEKIEADLWACVRGLEELVALLEDLEAYARKHGRGQIGGPHDGRVAQARDHVARLRAIVEEKRPVDLAAADLAIGAGPLGTAPKLPGGTD